MADRTGGLRAPAALLGLLLAATYAYFMPAPAWNEASRFALVRSLVERHAIDIDPYERSTEDKAFHAGHHYSDKAPGTAILAAPAYALYLARLKASGAPLPQAVPQSEVYGPDASRVGGDEPILLNSSYRRAVWVCNLTTNVPAGAALGALLLVLLVGAGVPPREALVATLTLAVGSLVFAYATMLYGHVLAAAALLGAFALGRPFGELPRAPRLLGAGALAGAAVLVELPSALGAAILIVALVARSRRALPALLFLAGMTPPLLLLAGYQTLAFGSPLRAGYGFVTHPAFAEGMSRGFFGISWPRPAALFALLLGRTRGLLYLSPGMALGFVGLARWLARPGVDGRPGDRGPALVATALVIGLLLVNAGYYMWWGGAALGPRHLIPALPFLALGIPFALRPGAVKRWTGVGLLVVSAAHQLAAVAVSPIPDFGTDLLGHAWGHLVRGELAILPGSANVGMLLGLRGLASLLPLLVLWVVGLPAIFGALPVLEPTASSG